MRFCFLCSIFLLIAWLLVIGDNVAGQSKDSMIIRTEVINVKDGLSQGLTSSIIQDKAGFMWIGTKDGLNKYDGYHFTIYRYQQGDPYSLPDNYVTALAEDENENLWVGTNTKGLFLFDRKSERFYPVKLFPDNDSVSFYIISNLQIINHQLLVLTKQLIIYDISQIELNNNGVVDLTKATIHFSDRKMLQPDRQLNGSIWVHYSWMKDQSLWFVYDDSIFIYTKSENGSYFKSKLFSCNDLGLLNKGKYCIDKLQNPDTYLFTGCKDILVYDFKTKHVVSKTEFNDNYQWGRHTIRDKHGNFFITGQEKCYYFNATDHALKLFKGEIGTSGFLDGNEILWTTTAGHGIIKLDYRKQLFNLITVENRVSDFHNNAGEVMILVNHKTPYFINPLTLKKRPDFPEAISKTDISVLDFAEDKKGNYWMLFDTDSHQKVCLLKYNPATGRLEKKVLPSYLTNIVVKLVVAPNDNILLSISDYTKPPRLALLNSNTLNIDKVYLFPAKIQNYGPFVTDYYNDAAGKIWFATLQGLYQFDLEKNKWMHWQNIAGDNNSLNNNQLLSIIPDPVNPEKYLWIGTDGGGLNRMEIATGKFVKYTEKDGLPNNVVYGLLSDKKGNIWMSTNRGLCCMLTTGSQAFIKFDSEDGLPGDEFNRTEYFKMPDGQLYFGGVEGPVVFDPEKILEKEKAPPIVFTGLSVFNKPVTYKTDSDIIQLPIDYAQTITLPHDKGMFSISFAALEYRSANKKLYRYMLKGYDKHWIDAGNKNEATYTNLSPGTYTLQVTGAGSTGQWNTKGASIKIVILPAWYQTWWFRLFTAMAVAAAAYALYRYRLHKALQLQKIRNRIASDLHDEIGSTISSISLSSNVIQKKLNGNSNTADVKKLVAQISDNTSNIMEVISDIVWTINTKNDSFANVIDRMRAFAVEILESKNISIHFDIDESANEIHMDMDKRKNLYLIFKETINNAAKYSQCKNVWIEIKLIRGRIRLLIKDDGIGFNINEKQKGKLSGNGLYNMQKRANDMKGKLVMESQPQQGTTMMLEFGV